MSRTSRFLTVCLIAIASVFAMTLVGCSESSDDNNSGTATFNATTFAGTWQGSWTNTTFSSTGAANATVTINGNAYTMTMDLDGNVFGGANPPIENLTATFNTSNATLDAKVSNVYGQLTGTLAADGTLTAAGTNIPGGVASFSLTGSWTATSITVNVVINFDAGGTANATATLNKV